MNSNIENAILIIDIVVHSGYVICGISIFLYLIVSITRNFINEMKFNDIINAKETVFYYILILLHIQTKTAFTTKCHAHGSNSIIINF